MAPQPDRHAVTRFVKDEALRLGFALVGITKPDPPPHLDVYRRWLAEERHGEMEYLARPLAVERREDPRKIMPECQSILVAGWAYPAPASPTTGGRIAAYAVGPDYHDVLIDNLRRLLTSVQDFLGRPFAYRAYTDTGPILERELAQQAGLGWIGKNTCLIHPRRGSYLLLAEALLDLDLEPDAPFHSDHCGTCTRCLDACPTACILPDRTIDARRCISYLTIELKGSIPPDLRPEIGDWLFGCDICQEVCPWNVRFAPASAPARTEAPTVHEILEVEAGSLRTRIRGTALRRTRRTGLVRNAAVVAGNSGAVEWTGALTRLLLEDSELLVRSHAAWALGRIGGAEAKRALSEALAAERDGQVRGEIRAALRACG